MEESGISAPGCTPLPICLLGLCEYEGRGNWGIKAAGVTGGKWERWE